jgi:hypothetical protein
MRPNKSPVVITDSAELTDNRLNEVEALAKLKEENRDLASRFQKPDQAILSNKDMAQGSPMEWRHLVYLLQKLCPSLIIKDGGVKDAIQVRYPDSAEMYREDGGTRYVTGFYKQVLPEFSWETLDEHGLPTKEIRGWRTVIKPLIMQRIVSYKAAVELFGEPHGQRSGRWKQTLQKYKYLTQ